VSVRSGHRQRGATLFVVLILLIGLAWFALSSFRISSQHLQIVGNSQADIQAAAAAQRAIEETISSNLFTKDPTKVAETPIATDVDGDKKTDFNAKLDPAPKCIRVRPIKTMELDIALPADRVCLQSAGTGGNLVAAPGATSASGDSLCANTEWNVAAKVEDAHTGAAVQVNQGVAVRVEKANAANFCK